MDVSVHHVLLYHEQLAKSDFQTQITQPWFASLLGDVSRYVSIKHSLSKLLAIISIVITLSCERHCSTRCFNCCLHFPWAVGYCLLPKHHKVMPVGLAPAVSRFRNRGSSQDCAYQVGQRLPGFELPLFMRSVEGVTCSGQCESPRLW